MTTFTPYTKKFLIISCLGIVAIAQERTPRAPESNSYLHGPPDKELIYVTVPGTLEGSADRNGTGIIVLDARDNYNFVKRIQTWDVPASKNSEQVSGVTASTVTQMIYVATRGRLVARRILRSAKASS